MDCVRQFTRPVDAEMTYWYVHREIVRQPGRTFRTLQDCPRIV